MKLNFIIILLIHSALASEYKFLWVPVPIQFSSPYYTEWKHKIDLYYTFFIIICFFYIFYTLVFYFTIFLFQAFIAIVLYSLS